MKRELADDLVCPVSSDPLTLEGCEADEVDAGELICGGCGRRWPIRNGIPRLVPPDLEEQQRKTASAFGWQWQHFVEMHPEFEAQFLDWLRPIEPEFFRGKRVLDAGCGTGRHAYYAASYGSEEVVALDLSGAVETAAPEPRLVRQRPRRPRRPPAASVPTRGAGRWLRFRLLDRSPPSPAGSVRRVPHARRIRPSRRHHRGLGVWPREQRLRAERRRAATAAVDEDPSDRTAWTRLAPRARVPRRCERRLPSTSRNGRRLAGFRSTTT